VTITLTRRTVWNITSHDQELWIPGAQWRGG